MEAQLQLRCRDCGRTASVRGEIPDEYRACLVEVIQSDGWVVAPGAQCDMLCGTCFATYEGSESHDDAEKISK